ncbi:unnamed protein product [Onchocerca ochengi]|uniref:Secreted protein n=1 Tax=Onchocerca ochengi TaxID=42157 RepID=A0A182ENK5_ONCOC|nr:unnamed protein product [Onchocerca ochengi]
MKNTIAVGGILGLKALTGDVPYIGSGNPWITYPRIAHGGAGLYSPHSLWGYDRNIFDGYYNSDHFDLYGNIFGGYGNLCSTPGRYGNICGGYGRYGNAGGIFGGHSKADRRYGNVGGIFGGYGNVGAVIGRHDNTDIYPLYQQYLYPRSLSVPSNFLTDPTKLLNSLTTTTKSPNPKSGRYYKGTGNPWLIQQ